jgi:hypothetical protein
LARGFTSSAARFSQALEIAIDQDSDDVVTFLTRLMRIAQVLDKRETESAIIGDEMPK